MITRACAYSSIALLLVACGADQSGPKVSAGFKPTVVETIQVKAVPWSYHIDSFGELSVAETVIIGVESAGVVKQLKLRDGMRVAAGDLLFALDGKKQQLRFEQSQASVSEAQSQLDQAQKTLDRFQLLREDGATSEDRLQQEQTNYDAAVARLQQARAALNIARTELRERQILSPVDGVVETESLEVGQYVQPGEQLAIIQADGALQVIAHVNEQEVVQINVGQQARVVVALADYQALIESIGRSANPKTGNYEVKLRIQGINPQLREGMAAQVNLPVDSNREVILVPRSAVVSRRRAQVVMLAEQGYARSRTVTFGLPAGDLIPVVAGLEAGQLLIVAPLDYVIDGTAIVLAPEASANDNTASEHVPVNNQSALGNVQD